MQHLETRVEQLEQAMKRLEIQVEQLENDLRELKEKLKYLETKVDNLEEETRSIGRSVAVIEYEHGDKLKALFEAFTTHNEKMDKQQVRIDLCEYKIEKQEEEIYSMNTKVQGL